MEEIRGCRYVQRISINIVRFCSLPPSPLSLSLLSPRLTNDRPFPLLILDIHLPRENVSKAHSPTWTIGLVAISCNNWSTYFDLSGYSSILEICRWNLSNVELFFLKQNEQHAPVSDNLQMKKRKNFDRIKKRAEFFFGRRDINSRGRI